METAPIKILHGTHALAPAALLTTAPTPTRLDGSITQALISPTQQGERLNPNAGPHPALVQLPSASPTQPTFSAAAPRNLSEPRDQEPPTIPIISDIEKLRLLKESILSGQHPLFRPNPNYAALAQLYLGPNMEQPTAPSASSSLQATLHDNPDPRQPQSRDSRGLHVDAPPGLAVDAVSRAHSQAQTSQMIDLKGPQTPRNGGPTRRSELPPLRARLSTPPSAQSGNAAPVSPRFERSASRVPAVLPSSISKTNLVPRHATPRSDSPAPLTSVASRVDGALSATSRVSRFGPPSHPTHSIKPPPNQHFERNPPDDRRRTSFSESVPPRGRQESWSNISPRRYSPPRRRMSSLERPTPTARRSSSASRDFPHRPSETRSPDRGTYGGPRAPRDYDRRVDLDRRPPHDEYEPARRASDNGLPARPAMAVVAPRASNRPPSIERAPMQSAAVARVEPPRHYEEPPSQAQRAVRPAIVTSPRVVEQRGPESRQAPYRPPPPPPPPPRVVQAPLAPPLPRNGTSVDSRPGPRLADDHRSSYPAPAPLARDLRETRPLPVREPPARDTQDNRSMPPPPPHLQYSESSRPTTEQPVHYRDTRPLYREPAPTLHDLAPTPREMLRESLHAPHDVAPSRPRSTAPPRDLPPPPRDLPVPRDAPISHAPHARDVPRDELLRRQSLESRQWREREAYAPLADRDLREPVYRAEYDARPPPAHGPVRNDAEWRGAPVDMYERASYPMDWEPEQAGSHDWDREKAYAEPKYHRQEPSTPWEAIPTHREDLKRPAPPASLNATPGTPQSWNRESTPRRPLDARLTDRRSLDARLTDPYPPSDRQPAHDMDRRYSPPASYPPPKTPHVFAPSPELRHTPPPTYPPRGMDIDERPLKRARADDRAPEYDYPPIRAERGPYPPPPPPHNGWTDNRGAPHARERETASPYSAPPPRTYSRDAYDPTYPQHLVTVPREPMARGRTPPPPPPRARSPFRESYP